MMFVAWIVLLVGRQLQATDKYAYLSLGIKTREHYLITWCTHKATFCLAFFIQGDQQGNNAVRISACYFKRNVFVV
jgi:hypothetical protein